MSNTHNIESPPCFFCNEDTVDNHCYSCTMENGLRDVVTFYDRHSFTKPHMFSVEMIHKNKLYIISYYVETDTTQINFTNLSEEIEFGSNFITSFKGFHITPVNIKARLPLCLLIS